MFETETWFAHSHFHILPFTPTHLFIHHDSQLRCPYDTFPHSPSRTSPPQRPRPPISHLLFCLTPFDSFFVLLWTPGRLFSLFLCITLLHGSFTFIDARPLLPLHHNQSRHMSQRTHPTHPSIHPPIHPFIHPSIHPFIHPSPTHISIRSTFMQMSFPPFLFTIHLHYVYVSME